MADLPTYQQNVLLGNVGVISPADTQYAWAGVTSALNNATNEIVSATEREQHKIEEKDVADARLAGSNAVTRNSQGDIVVVPRDNSTAANRAFNAGQLTRYRSEMEIDARRRASDAAIKYQGDPNGFDAYWKGDTEGRLAQVPQMFRGEVTPILEDVGRQTYGGLLTNKAETDKSLATAAWKATHKARSDDLMALASAGMLHTDAGDKATLAYQVSLEDGVNSHFIDPALAQVDRDEMAGETTARSISKMALDVYNKKPGLDGVAAANAVLNKEVLDNPDLKLPEAMRRRVVDHVQERIREAETLRHQRIAEVRDAASDTLRKLDLGYPVEPAALNGFAGQAAAAGDYTFATRLRNEASIQSAVSGFSKKPLDEQRAILEQQDRIAQDPKTGAAAAELAQAFARAHNRKATALRDDSFAFGTRAYEKTVGPVAPLDFTKPADLAGALQSRQKQADYIGGYEGVPTVPMFKEEVNRLGNILNTADAATQAQLMAGLSDGLGSKYLAPVMAQLEKKGDKARLFTTAAGLSQTDKGLARDVLFGDDVRRANKGATPSDSTKVQPYVDRIYGNTFELMPDARAAIVDAGLAVYAGVSNAKGDFSGNLDENRLRDSLYRITGKPVTMNGRSALPPRPDMTQSDFDGMIAGLTDADLGPIPKAADGSNVTAAVVKKSGQLVSSGDGRYLVLIKGQTVVDPVTGGDWHINLRDAPIRDATQPRTTQAPVY